LIDEGSGFFFRFFPGFQRKIKEIFYRAGIDFESPQGIIAVFKLDFENVK
jgi:hypothetical protein